MKVLMTARGFDSGDAHKLGIFELDQAKALRDAGHDVRIAAIDTRSVRRRRPLGCRKYEMDGIPVYYCAVPAGSKPVFFAEWAQRKAAASIWKAAARDGWGPELVHAHFGAGLLAEAKRRGVPTVYTEHFSGTNQADPPAAELRRERETYALADRLICVSRALAQRVTEHTGVVPHVIHNIVDTEVFTCEKKEGRVRTCFHFVSAGNLIPGKGFDLLLTAYARVRESHNDLRLTVIGDGAEEQTLKAMAQHLGVGESVHFTGRLSREEMREIYRDADAFVLASRGETFGVVYVEAMAAGLPVIATACGGPEDFVNDANGILIPTEDPGALADAMERMIRTRDAYDSAAIAAFARENFSPETIARQITAVYEELLSC